MLVSFNNRCLSVARTVIQQMQEDCPEKDCKECPYFIHYHVLDLCKLRITEKVLDSIIAEI